MYRCLSKSMKFWHSVKRITILRPVFNFLKLKEAFQFSFFFIKLTEVSVLEQFFFKSFHEQILKQISIPKCSLTLYSSIQHQLTNRSTSKFYYNYINPIARQVVINERIASFVIFYGSVYCYRIIKKNLYQSKEFNFMSMHG